MEPLIAVKSSINQTKLVPLALTEFLKFHLFSVGKESLKKTSEYSYKWLREEYPWTTFKDVPSQHSMLLSKISLSKLSLVDIEQNSVQSSGSEYPYL